MHRSVYLAIATLVTLCTITMPVGAADAPGPLPQIDTQVQGLEKLEGLLTLYLDRQRGKVLLEVPPSDDPDVGHQLLYIEGLVTGLGSNDVGLDRGQIGPARLVGLRRVGGRVLVEEVNLGYRALSDDSDELRAVRQSFARSVLWGGAVEAADADGSVLVDFTSFIVRDAHMSADRLETTGQGTFALDASRSAVDVDGCLVFPENVEFDAILTFGGKKPGQYVRETAPSATSVTLIQHHSFLKLPDDGYRPRAFDPRMGSFGIAFFDYAAPLDQSIEKRWIVRHRLEKIDPTAARSKVVEPIVYYVDRGVPEPIRSALVEGAGWWAEAFDAAGFIDAYRVEVLPEGVHNLDARYNVIQWVHRSTRGWSYGGGVVDPRTGEMIKGHVSLGSLRVRQDRLLFQGLAGADGIGSGTPDDPVEIALARIRQLSAHEVGHTLGFTHNFAASTRDRDSVMDYPAPLIGIDIDGELDFKRAYGVGMGEWDLHAVRWAYSEFPPGAEVAGELDTIVRDGLDGGLFILSDGDARPPGAANPLANLWDNGDDPVEQLEHDLEVRRIAIDRFGASSIPDGSPLAGLEAVLVPLYLHHRYQLQAATKVIGGLDYRHVLRGDGQIPTDFIDPERQRRALDVVLSILDPEVLDIPESILAIIPPQAPGSGSRRELFDGAADPVFDPLGAAATAAQMVVVGLLQPERAGRLVDFNRRDPEQPGLEAVLDAVIAQVFANARPLSARRAEIRRVVQTVALEGLITLSGDAGASPGVRSRVDNRLNALRGMLESSAEGNRVDAANRAALIDRIDQHQAGTTPPTPAPPPAAGPPPGDPIG